MVDFVYLIWEDFLIFIRASLVAQMIKHLPAMQETQVWFLGQEDPLKKRMATHSSIFAMENPMDRGAWQTIYSPWGGQELNTTKQLSTHTHTIIIIVWW